MASTSIGGADICPGAGALGSASAVTQTIAPITTGIHGRKTNALKPKAQSRASFCVLSPAIAYRVREAPANHAW